MTESTPNNDSESLATQRRGIDAISFPGTPVQSRAEESNSARVQAPMGLT
jgi:hypothetical protein